MAIATLSTLAATHFKGGRNITTGAPTSQLAYLVNLAVAKVNEVIASLNAGTLDVLDVGGGGAGAGLYYGASDSWFQVDGTNPPTCSRFRIQDQDDGSFKTASYSTSGGLVFA